MTIWACIRVPYITIVHFPCGLHLLNVAAGTFTVRSAPRSVFLLAGATREGVCAPVPALCRRPQSGTRGELSSQRMAAGCDSPDKGHATLRWISAAGTQAPGIPQAWLLHRELGARAWGLPQVTELLFFLICKMEIVLPASWSYLRGYIKLENECKVSVPWQVLNINTR